MNMNLEIKACFSCSYLHFMIDNRLGMISIADR